MAELDVVARLNAAEAALVNAQDRIAKLEARGAGASGVAGSDELAAFIFSKYFRGEVEEYNATLAAPATENGSAKVEG